jgi:hypothetical protein
MGLTWSLNQAATLRLCGFDYQHSWNRRRDGLDYENGLRISAGISLRLGRWTGGAEATRSRLYPLLLP